MKVPQQQQQIGHDRANKRDLQELDRQHRQWLEQSHKRTQRHVQNRHHPGRKAQTEQDTPTDIGQRHYHRHQRE